MLIKNLLSRPEAEEVAPFVQEDQLFLILYKELYYRHIYARVQGGPTLEQRYQSTPVYRAFFNCQPWLFHLENCI